MTAIAVAPRRTFGVHLADGPDSGLRTWVCRAHPGAAGIRLEGVDPIAELPGGAADSEVASRALVTKILEAQRSAWGFDFAFGLPLGAAGGRDTAADRQTDRERGLPGPLTVGRAEATRRGMREIVGPLWGNPAVVVLPFDPLPVLAPGTPPAMAARAASIYLLEVSPACLLGEIVGAPTLAPEAVEDRARMVRCLVDRGWLRPASRALRQRAAERPESLAAVAAAVAAWRGTRRNDHGLLAANPAYRAEGYVYC
jgi:hypothetical protein